MNKNHDTGRVSAAAWRRGIRAHALISVFLAAILVVMINYLSSHHYFREDLSHTQFFRLSEGTRALLRELREPLSITVLFPSNREGYNDIRLLLEEYTEYSPRVSVYMVDPHRDPERADELMRRYGIEQPNVVIVAASEMHRVVQESDIIELDTRPVLRGKPPIKLEFRGEEAISSAINEVTQAERPVVYFLVGHGEYGPGVFDAERGYSRALQALEHDNIEVRSLNLGRDRDIPGDCAALVIAGPRYRYSSQIVSVLSESLDRSGRLMLLLDSHTDVGLDDFLEKWGVFVGNDIVLDPARTRTGRELYVYEYPDHPITRKLQGLITIFHLPRSVEPLEMETDAAVDRPRVRELATTSSRGWADTELNTDPMRFDPSIHRGGRLSVAVAVERGEGLDMGIRSTRMVVIGDASFVTNQALRGANLEFFRNAINWLVERESRLDIPPKIYGQTRLVLTRHEMIVIGAVLILGLPMAVALVGIMVGLRRRR